MRFLLLLALLPFATCAQNTTSWNGKKAAIALTYDDALNVHLDKVIPALDSAGFKATFYLIGSAPAFTQRIPEWRKAAAKGHELGNHTLYHPCYGKRPGREWVTPDYDLNNYTLRRMVDEIKVNNALLEATDGKKRRTLACPCGDTRVGDSSYLYSVKENFVAVRDGTPDAIAVNAFNTFPVQGFAPIGHTGDQLVAAVQKAMESNALLVFIFHGVGGDHSLNISIEAHQQLLQFLKKNQSQLWIAPFMDIAEYMQKQKP